MKTITIELTDQEHEWLLDQARVSKQDLATFVRSRLPMEPVRFFHIDRRGTCIHCGMALADDEGQWPENTPEFCSVECHGCGDPRCPAEEEG